MRPDAPWNLDPSLPSFCTLTLIFGWLYFLAHDHAVKLAANPMYNNNGRTSAPRGGAGQPQAEADAQYLCVGSSRTPPPPPTPYYTLHALAGILWRGVLFSIQLSTVFPGVGLLNEFAMHLAGLRFAGLGPNRHYVGYRLTVHY